MHLKKVYEKKHNSINDYLHKVTGMIAEYCRTNDISVVVIGDIRNIRRSSNLGCRRRTFGPGKSDFTGTVESELVVPISRMTGTGDN